MAWFSADVEGASEKLRVYERPTLGREPTGEPESRERTAGAPSCSWVGPGLTGQGSLPVQSQFPPWLEFQNNPALQSVPWGMGPYWLPTPTHLGLSITLKSPLSVWQMPKAWPLMTGSMESSLREQSQWRTPEYRQTVLFNLPDLPCVKEHLPSLPPFQGLQSCFLWVCFLRSL